METFSSHLINRARVLYPLSYSWIDWEEELVTFPLWTVHGNLVGYQVYHWKADKLRNNDTKGRYWTYRRKDVLTCWGLEFIDLFSTKPLYVVEGIWDAISVIATGRRCIAVLSNNPKQLKNWLSCLPCKTIAICDGDKAGKVLAKCCDEYLVLADDNDANDLTLEELQGVLKNYEQL